MDRLEQEMNDLKKEVIEARNMNIKTENTLRGLFSEVKKVTVNQASAQRHARFTSVGMLFLIVLVLGAAGFYLNRMLTANLEAEIQRQRQALAASDQQIKDLKLVIEARESTEKRVAYLLKLIRDGKKEEAVEEYHKIDMPRLNETEVAVLKEKLDVILAELARRHYDLAMGQWRMGGFKNAVAEFNLSRGFKSDTDYMASLLFYRGLSLYETKRYDEAVASLKDAVAAGLSNKLDSDTARLKTIDAFMKGERYDEAIAYIEKLPQEQMTMWNRQTAQMKLTQAREALLRKQSAMSSSDDSSDEQSAAPAPAGNRTDIPPDKRKGKRGDKKSDKPAVKTDAAKKN